MNRVVETGGASERLRVGKVQVLAQEIIHRIAAGEVVDRPASALKELLENALDAGALHLRVQIVDGGLGLIEVDDDGAGMSREDLEVALQRHATSKLSSIDDLDAIASLGFRGEALAAISSIAKVVIDTRRDEGGAWRLSSNGSSNASTDASQNKKISPSARERKGTRLRVSDLFFNVPARRKFLKTPGREAAACFEVIERIALTCPEVAIDAYVADEKGEVKKQLQLESQSLLERYQSLSTLPGRTPFFISEIKPAPGVELLEIAAYPPPAAGGRKSDVQLIVNGRFVEDARLPYSMREAYSGLIEVREFPYVLVRVEVDPSIIDVNIHPQKKEIRWPSGFSLAGLAYRLLRRHLEEIRPPSMEFSAPAAESLNFDFVGSGRAFNTRAEHDSLENNLAPSSADFLGSFEGSEGKSNVGNFPIHQSSVDTSVDTNVNKTWSGRSNEEASDESLQKLEVDRTSPTFRFSSLRVVGEVGAAWIICESAQGMVLIDQHAAHERVRFEEILATKTLLRTKALLVPMEITLPLGLENDDPELLKLMKAFGFEWDDLEHYPKDRFPVSAVPDSDRKINWKNILAMSFREIVENDTATDRLLQIKNQIAASLACHSSVRRGQRLSEEAMRALLARLDEVKWGGLCPHGRPVYFLLSHESIEKEFHR